MSFLGWPSEHHLLSMQMQWRRRTRALRLIQLFADTFKTVEYDLFWETPILNAQAWRQGTQQRVTVYGGLVRHLPITSCGLALMLAHETGHHLGGPPYDPDLRWPTWQGQADYWAASEGMPKVFGKNARRMTLEGAEQIAALHAAFSNADEDSDISPEARLAIFRAGALGESAAAHLQAAFNRTLSERR